MELDQRFGYENDEFVVVASERPVIQTAFELKAEDIQEIKPGHALIIKKDGQFQKNKLENHWRKISVHLNEFTFLEELM